MGSNGKRQKWSYEEQKYMTDDDDDALSGGGGPTKVRKILSEILK